MESFGSRASTFPNLANNMNLIRTANLSDADVIARVHIDSWQTTYRGLMPDKVLDNLSFERRREWWQGILRDQSERVLVAEENDQIVGFAYFGEEREHDPIYHGELYAIYLLAGCQKKGIGHLLFKASAKGLIKLGMSDMLLWVLSTNPARKFYEKMGGKYLRDKSVEIGDETLQESAYGWDDIHLLVESK